MIGSGAAVGEEAARRLAGLGMVQIEPGLTEAELADVERRFGFQFADDHRAFLAAGLPVWADGGDDHPDKVGWGWPRWRDHGPRSCVDSSTGRWSAFGPRSPPHR